jgi:hypothetical protein
VSQERDQQDSEVRIEMSPVIITKPGIDPGTYTLELMRVRETQGANFENPALIEDRIELTFAIRDHARWGNTEFADKCTVQFGPRSKLGRITTALNGGVPLPFGQVDLETLVGRRMKATIRRTDSGYNSVVHETVLPLDSKDPQDA